MRETLAVADLIPGDIILPEGWKVVGYPYGIPGLPGTIVTVDKFDSDIYIGHYYGYSETQVQVIR